jgi:hypothetical protein
MACPQSTVAILANSYFCKFDESVLQCFVTLHHFNVGNYGGKNK